MKRKLCLSLILVFFFAIGTILPVFADIPLQYQVEWTEEHDRYLVSEWPEELEVISTRFNEVIAYITSVASYMTYADYESGFAMTAISALVERYLLPLLVSVNSIDEETQPSSTSMFVSAYRSWENNNPNFSVPSSITYTTIVSGGRAYSGTINLVHRSSFRIGQTSMWYHGAFYEGWISFFGIVSPI